MLVGIGICEFVGRCGISKPWDVDIEVGFSEVGIIKDKADKNLRGEGGVAIGEIVAFAAEAL